MARENNSLLQAIVVIEFHVSTGLDDRTAGESGHLPLSQGERRIPKSRWGTVSSYLSQQANQEPVKMVYNDINFELHEDCLGKMLKAGMDEPLAKYFGQMFVR